MTSKPTDINALKIEIAKDGTASLVGINYRDLRNLITAASLYRSGNPFKPEPLRGDCDEITHENNMESARWHLDQRLVIGCLDAALAEAIHPGHGEKARVIESAKSMHELSLHDLEEEVREAEKEAAVIASKKLDDPLLEIAKMLQGVVQQADGALIQLKRVQASAAKT